MVVSAKSSYNFKESIVKLYHILSNLDNNYGAKEERLLELMMSYEGISHSYLKEQRQKITSLGRNEISLDAMALLKRCDHQEQVRCVAWLARIANADGFMSTNEWSLIYDTYKKWLKIDLNDVMTYELPDIMD